MTKEEYLDSIYPPQINAQYKYMDANPNEFISSDDEKPQPADDEETVENVAPPAGNEDNEDNDENSNDEGNNDHKDNDILTWFGISPVEGYHGEGQHHPNHPSEGLAQHRLVVMVQPCHSALLDSPLYSLGEVEGTPHHTVVRKHCTPLSSHGHLW